MIESVDGRGSFDGRSSALGDAGDRQVFRALRSVCDVVLVGTGTLATEHYGRLVRDADVQAARERGGLAAQPLLCTVTRSGHIPPGIPLLADPDARMVIYSGAAVDLGDAAASVQVVTVDPAGCRSPPRCTISASGRGRAWFCARAARPFSGS